MTVLVFLFFFFLSLETITTVSLLTFYSNTLMALFVLMACCNPISGDLSLFLMASASHSSILQAASDEDTHTLYHPTRHNERSSAVLPLLPCPYLCLAACEMVHSFLLILPGGVTGRLIRLDPACLPSERTHSEGCVCLLGLILLCHPRQLVAEWSLWPSFPPLCPPVL